MSPAAPFAGTGSLELAHARLWARWGRRPDASSWRRIEVTRDLDAVLVLAHAGPLGRWLDGLDGRADLHRVDRRLRAGWRACTDELAGWMPDEWRDAVRWCATLVDLPRWQHLARDPQGQDPHEDRIAADAECLPWLRQRSARLVLAQLALGRALRADPDRALAGWLAAWHELLPAGRGATRLLDGLVPALRDHHARFGTAGLADAGPLRLQLQSRLLRLMRRHPVEPLCAFAYLALCALELERLRGELVRRAAFPDRGIAP